MNTETIEYKGYKITVAQDESPENPFEAWDCEPPLLTYYGGRHGYFKSYGGPESIGDIVRLVPLDCFSRGQRVALIKETLNCTLREFAETVRDNSSWNERGSESETRDAFALLVEEQVGREPFGWRDAIAWFEMAESLLTWAGIECVNTQSNGYCQGDSTLVLAIATPEWLKVTGVQPEHVKSSLNASVDLYSAWAWGDVYGVSEIIGPGPNGVCSECDVEFPEEHESGCSVEWTEGEEIENGSCWGFYGSDHEKSGLMEHARSAIDYHIQQQAETALNAPACLI